MRQHEAGVGGVVERRRPPPPDEVEGLSDSGEVGSGRDPEDDLVIEGDEGDALTGTKRVEHRVTGGAQVAEGCHHVLEFLPNRALETLDRQAGQNAHAEILQSYGVPLDRRL